MKKLAMVIAAAILVLGIVALDLLRELHTEREQQAALQTRVTELEAAQKSTATPRTPSAPDRPIATQTETPATPAAGPENGPSDRARSGTVAGITQMMASPEGQVLMRNQMRAQLAQQFPDLARELNLSQAEAEKFFDLLARQGTDSLGDAFGLMGGGDSKAMQESQRRMAERQLANEAELKAMLGGRYPQWQEYQGTIAARQQVSQLRAMLGSGDNALGEAQTKPLVAALGVETARINQEMRDKMVSASRNSQNVLEEQLRYTSEQNHRLISVASRHLNAAQLDGYKRMLTQQENLARMMLGAMNGQGNASGRGGSTP
ncbi:MAG: hypothetical protein ABIQ86_04600 [Steroidobacteraceae bacterium]